MFFEAKAQEVYQHKRKEILKNPHPLGLEMKLAEEDQGIIHNPAEGSVEVMCAPDQPKSFQIVLTNTRERDENEDDEECIVLADIGVLRGLDSGFTLSNPEGIPYEDLTRNLISLWPGWEYKINVRAVASQVGDWKTALMVAFRPEDDILNTDEYMALELFLKSEDDDETHKLLEESMERISALETETEKLKAESVQLEETNNLLEERANAALKTAEDNRKKLELELVQVQKLESDLLAAHREIEEQAKSLEKEVLEKERLKDKMKKLTNFFGKSPEKERRPVAMKSEERVDDVAAKDDEVIAAERPGDGAQLGIENTLSEKIVDTRNTSTEAVREKCKPEESASRQQGEPEKQERSSLPQKRPAPESADNALTFQLRQHKMFLTMIESGLSQLIRDEETPESMLGSLSALKHYTTFPIDSMQPLNKRIKTSGIPKVEKQEEEEYFEDDTIKIEPMDESPAEVSSSQQQ